MEDSDGAATDLGEARASAALWMLVLAGGLFRFALSLFVMPSVDECYTVVMARRFALSYYDHPPMMTWLAGSAARLAGTEHRLAVRFPFILAFALTTALVYHLGARLFGRTAGLMGAVALNLTLFFGVCAGSWVLPDGPLHAAAAAAALCFATAVLGSAPGERLLPWLGYGLFTGLALLSKYHGVFLAAGGGLFLLTSSPHRHWLRRPGPYLAGVLALAVFSPVLLWNAGHGWASFRFQSGRADTLPGTGGNDLLGSLAGQAGWMLPWVWVPLCLALWSALRAGPREPGRWLLACLAVGPIVGFTLLTALGRPGFPHWTAPGYFFTFPLLGADMARRLRQGARWPWRWAVGSAAALILVAVGLASHTANGWLGRVAPSLVRAGDPTLDLVPWDALPSRIASFGQPEPGIVIAGAVWSDSAKIAYTLGPDFSVACIGADPRGFHFVTDQRSLLGRDVLLIVRRRPGPEIMRTYARYFQELTTFGTYPASWGRDEPVLSFYLGRHLLAPVPSIRPL